MSDVDVGIPLWVRITLERYAIERILRWEGRFNLEGDPERDAYDDMMDELREQFEAVDGGSGRFVVEITEFIDSDERMVAKIVAGSRNKHENIPVSGGFLQNWREILLSRHPPVEDIVLPVVASSPTGLWLVMPHAEQYGIEWDRDRIDAKADRLQSLDGVEPVMRGSFGGGLDVYWTENWGAYRGEYRLLDYGGVVLHGESYLRPEEYPFEDPAWDSKET
ncbi:hypothetical protein [Natrialba magadii]|nr:hypothetical protein [Natrialba magadii]